MSWFTDFFGEQDTSAYGIGQTLADPTQYAGWKQGASQLAGTKFGNQLEKTAQQPYKNLVGQNPADIDAANAADQTGVQAQLGTDQNNFNSWENLAQKLESGKFATDKQGLASDSASNLANATNNLAMKGGLSAGANERLADSNMNGFQDAYSNMATKYGLGAADISKSRYEKQAELEQARLIGADKAAAVRQAGKGGLLSGLFG